MVFSGKILVIDDEVTMLKLTKDVFDMFDIDAFYNYID